MKNKTHYIISMDWSFDMEGSPSIEGLSHSKELIQKKFKEIVLREIENSWISDDIEISDDVMNTIENDENLAINRNGYALTYESESMCFEAYKDGEYIDKHTLICVETIESED